ncbi:PREDICTED: 28 kDa ribonucleo [Prunus dulcis]|uniref:PREDICTED: 28 kDa ribonucleo n=1 Tax=Prunus dulcis TaxID=3755 RepID=A0A5E4G2C6_PRUDU|nr:PREDICTED: 28 kDa ribonucleo [Prunus dulcis]
MAAFEAALSVSSLYSSSFSSYSSKFFASPKPSTSLTLHISNYIPPISRNFLYSSPPCIRNNPTRKPFFELMCSAVQEVTAEEEAVEEKAEETQTQNLKRKLYVVNLPWSLTVVDIKNLFGECGTVTDVEIIKQPNGKSRGFAFVTMASGEEAQAVIEKFHSHYLVNILLSTRNVLVLTQKNSVSPPPPNPQIVETRYKLYVSNLGWKVRSSHLRDFVSENFKVPVSARVVFSGPSGKSGGYGFLSFATKEEAESAVSSLNGKELMGRPLNLKFSEKNVSNSGSQKDEEEKFEGQPEEL